MTWSAAFALFGVPITLLVLGWAAVLLQERSNRHTVPAGAQGQRTAARGGEGGIAPTALESVASMSRRIREAMAAKRERDALPLEARLKSLKERHAAIEKRIADELKRPSPDRDLVKRLEIEKSNLEAAIAGQIEKESERNRLRTDRDRPEPSS